jgi:hypothetical protein
MKRPVFWDITPLKVNRRFGGSVASIFRVEEYAKQETGVKQVTSYLRR